MYNSQSGPPAWAVELPADPGPSAGPLTQEGLTGVRRRISSDQQPTLQVPEMSALGTENRPLSAPVTGSETPQWRFTVSPAVPQGRPEERTCPDPRTTLDAGQALV